MSYKIHHIRVQSNWVPRAVTSAVRYFTFTVLRPHRESAQLYGSQWTWFLFRPSSLDSTLAGFQLFLRSLIYTRTTNKAVKTADSNKQSKIDLISF